MSVHNIHEFEARWAELSPFQRSEVIHDALTQLCIDNEVPVPRLEVLSGSGTMQHPNAYGQYYSDTQTIMLYADMVNSSTGVRHFDDPWEAINTIGHEFEHYYLDFHNEDYSKNDREAIAHHFGDVYEHEYKVHYTNDGEFGPPRTDTMYE